MPQIQFETFSSQIFWLFICFSVLSCSSFFALRHTATLFIERGRILEDTKSKINDIEKEIESIIEETLDSISKARLKSRELLLSIERDCLIKVNKEKQDLVKEIHSRFKLEREQLYRGKSSSLVEIKVLANSLAVEIVDKILGDQVKGSV